MKNRKHLSADGLFHHMRQGMTKIDDHRPKNISITLADALMSGLAMFVLKDPSLLAFGGRRKTSENLRKVFGIADMGLVQFYRRRTLAMAAKRYAATLPDQRDKAGQCSCSNVVYNRVRTSSCKRSLYGPSSGVRCLIKLGLDVPEALYLGTLGTDMSKTDDFWYTGDGIDCLPATYDGFVQATSGLYEGTDHIFKIRR